MERRRRRQGIFDSDADDEAGYAGDFVRDRESRDGNDGKSKMILLTAKFRRGFTLIEILVGLVISTMILGAAASVFVTGTRSWEKGNRAYKTMQTARTIADLIERHLRS